MARCSATGQTLNVLKDAAVFINAPRAKFADAFRIFDVETNEKCLILLQCKLITVSRDARNDGAVQKEVELCKQGVVRTTQNMPADSPWHQVQRLNGIITTMLSKTAARFGQDFIIIGRDEFPCYFGPVFMDVAVSTLRLLKNLFGQKKDAHKCTVEILRKRKNGYSNAEDFVTRTG
ncbi:hypothetical protein HDU86_001331 [Geranomyces michiganensis]|nr:hypothetical protein HDU86_001331 [Geranomyces michiganensis]